MSLGPPTYTTEEVADHYHVKPSTVQNWVREGRIVALNLGGRRRGPYVFRKDDLMEFERSAETQRLTKETST